MPRQNRVTPFSVLEQSSARGDWMGNRGLLHNREQRIVRQFRRDLDRWLICRLEFKNWHRPIMRPGHYTELFYLDEATAFAAGHRPCFECRRADAQRFLVLCELPSAAALDRALAPLRGPSKRRESTLGSVPDGAFVTLGEAPEIALLKWRGGLHRWIHHGYETVQQVSPGLIVAVVTPPLTCAAFARGYVPQVHASVMSASSESLN